jgi:hypothetical protein
MGVRWERCDPLERAAWMRLISEPHLKAFRESIQNLKEVNDILDRPSVAILNFSKLLGAWMDRRVFRQKVSEHLEEFEKYAARLQAQEHHQCPVGKIDHMSWESFPEVEKYYEVRREAEKELLRH